MVIHIRHVLKRLSLMKKIMINKILFGLAIWKSLDYSNPDLISLHLFSWDVTAKVSNKITLRIDCPLWTTRTRQSFIKEFSATSIKAQKSYNNKNKKLNWVFFIGNQDVNDVNLFHINNRKLISIVYAQI
jgi:hypothetical protein